MTTTTRTPTRPTAKNTKMQFRMTPKQRQQFQLIASAMDKTESELGRDILMDWLRRNASRFEKAAA